MRDAVPAADHGLLAQTIGRAEARREILLVGGGAGVPRHAALAADQDVVRGGIEADRAVVVVREDRIVFPAQAVVDGQVLGDLPWSRAYIDQVEKRSALGLWNCVILPTCEG